MNGVMWWLVCNKSSNNPVFTYSSVLQEGVAVMFFPQEVVEHIVMTLASSVPQRYPPILSLNLTQKYKCGRMHYITFTSEEAPLSTSSFATSR